MIQVNILESLKTLFNIFKDNKYIVHILLIAIFSIIVLLVANKFKNKKITKILCILVYFGIFGTLLYFYHKEIFKLFDYLMNNIFLFLFFPNLAIYVLVLISINIIIIKSTFSKDDNKLIRNTNIIFFILFNIIFYLIIDNVVKNNINVYEQLSIYTNNDLLILIELSMNLFLLWLVILLIIKISNILITKIAFKKGINKKLNLDLVINEEEYKNIQNTYKVSEVYPTNIKEECFEFNDLNISTNNDILENKYNIYNEYLDIVPVKKQKVRKIQNIEEIPSNFLKENKEEVEETSFTHLKLSEKNLKIEINKDDIKPIIENREENMLNTFYNGEKISSFNIVEPTFLNISFENQIENDSNRNNNNNNFNQKEVKTFNLEVSQNNDFVLENDLKNEHHGCDYKEKVVNLNNMDLLFKNDTTNNNSLKNIILDIEKLRVNRDDKNQIQKIYEKIKLNQNNLTLSDYNYLIEMLITVKK